MTFMTSLHLSNWRSATSEINQSAAHFGPAPYYYYLRRDSRLHPSLHPLRPSPRSVGYRGGLFYFDAGKLDQRDLRWSLELARVSFYDRCYYAFLAHSIDPEGEGFQSLLRVMDTSALHDPSMTFEAEERRADRQVLMRENVQAISPGDAMIAFVNWRLSLGDTPQGFGVFVESDIPSVCRIWSHRGPCRD